MEQLRQIQNWMNRQGSHGAVATGMMVALLFLFADLAASAQDVRKRHVEAELRGGTSINANGTLRLALHFKMEEGWHIYWRNPGDAGMATSMEWDLPSGWRIEQVEWPVPDRHGDPPEVTYGYEGDIVLRMQLVPPMDATLPDSITIGAKVAWLVCNNVCIPGNANLSLVLHPASLQKGVRNLELWELDQTSYPLPTGKGQSPVEATAVRTAGGITLRLLPINGRLPDGDVYFYPYVEGVIDHSARQSIMRDESTGSIEINLAPSPFAQKEVDSLEGIVVAESAWGITVGRGIEISVPTGR